MAHEKVTLYGVPIVVDRLVNYGRIDPDVARELFIRHALVQGEWRTHHRFFRHNQACSRRRPSSSSVPAVAGSWSTTRRSFDFYDARVARRRRLDGALRLVVEERAGAPIPTC